MIADVLKSIFTWWNGATIGIRFHIGRSGVFVGEDEFGNRYYEARTNKDSYDRHKRRWVTYRGYAEATKVPPDWHGWLHHTWQEPPTRAPLARKPWEQPHQENLTGTALAYRPRTSILAPQPVAPARDYEAWAPE